MLQWFDVLVDDRAHLSRILRDQGIGHRAFWHPLHSQGPYRDDDDRFPVSIDVASRGLWLPSGVSMTQLEVEKVGEAVRDALRVQGAA